MKSWTKFKRWMRQGKVRPTTSVPFQDEKEDFKGVKVTLPSFFEWWFGKEEDK